MNEMFYSTEQILSAEKLIARGRALRNQAIGEACSRVIQRLKNLIRKS